METGESYFERKYEEVQLINSCLDIPRAVARPRTIEAMIEQKFQLSAARKAEHALAAWAATETRWTNAAPLRVVMDASAGEIKVSTASAITAGRTLFILWDRQTRDLAPPPGHRQTAWFRPQATARGPGALSDREV